GGGRTGGASPVRARRSDSETERREPVVGQAVRSDPGRTEQLLAGPVALREDSLAERFYHMLALPSDRLEASLRQMIQAEHELPDAARYPAVLERLRAWLDLDAEDARIIARAWDQAIATFPDAYASRGIEAERAVILNGLSFD